VLTLISVAIFAVAILVIAQLPHDDTVDVIDFDLATPVATSCTYDADTQQTTIRTHLDATTRHSSDVVLTAGVRDATTAATVAVTEKTIRVRGHHESDYTFVVDVTATAHADGATACFVESAASL
jgi:hypothetical protein